MYSWIEARIHHWHRSRGGSRGQVEPLDRLHHADVALGNELGDRQAVAAIAHGDLGHEAQMAGHQLMGGFGIHHVRASLGEHELLLELKERNFRISCR